MASRGKPGNVINVETRIAANVAVSEQQLTLTPMQFDTT